MLRVACALVVAVLAGAACAEDGASRPVDAAAPVARFVADARAKKPVEVLASSWDGERFARRVFSTSWESFSAAERGELSRVSARFEARDASIAFGAGEGKSSASPVPDLEVGSPVVGASERGTTSVTVTLSGTVGGKRESLTLRFLVTDSTPARIVECGASGSAPLADSVINVRRELGETGTDPLVWAWRELAKEEPPPDSVVYASPPAPRPEWMTRDCPAVDLPHVPGVEPDSRVDVVPDARWGSRVVVHLTRDGAALVRRDGRRSPFDTIRWATPSPVEQWKAVERVRASLEEAAKAAGPRAADGTAPLTVLVRADRVCLARSLGWVVDAAAHPSVRARSIGLVTAGASDDRPGVLALEASQFTTADLTPEVELPPRVEGEESGSTPEPISNRDAVWVSLFRLNAEDPARMQTKVKLRRSGVPTVDVITAAGRYSGVAAEDAARAATLDEQYARVAAWLADAKAASGHNRAILQFPPPFGPRVPVEDAIRAIAAVRASGLPLRAIGLPPPPLPRPR